MSWPMCRFCFRLGCGLTLIGTRFSPHVKNQVGGGGKKTKENLQYLGSLTSDFDEIFTVSSQINLAYNPVEIFELPHWMISEIKVK